MSAGYNVTITAENALNAPTTNFRSGPDFYEHPVAVLVTAPPITGIAGPHYRNIAEALLGFGPTGTKNIIWNDTNTSLRLGFNYQRKTNNAINPFRIDGNQTNVDANASYTGAVSGLIADVNGTDLADANVTFVYGRAHMARTRAMCGIGSSCTSYPVFYYEFYGDKGADPVLISQLLTTPTRSVDSVNWYKNTLHVPATDGNVTASVAITDVTSAYATDTSATSTTRGTLTYDPSNKGYPYKVTVDVTSPTQTKRWLIYDKHNVDGASRVSGQLEFYGPGKWSSSGGADASVSDQAVDTNDIKKNTNRRIRW